MTQEQKLQTEYASAWEFYKSTVGYQTSVAIMKRRDMKQPYIDNILRDSFDHAWNTERNLPETEYIVKE